MGYNNDELKYVKWKHLFYEIIFTLILLNIYIYIYNSIVIQSVITRMRIYYI